MDISIALWEPAPNEIWSVSSSSQHALLNTALKSFQQHLLENESKFAWSSVNQRIWEKKEKSYEESSQKQTLICAHSLNYKTLNKYSSSIQCERDGKKKKKEKNGKQEGEIVSADRRENGLRVRKMSAGFAMNLKNVAQFMPAFNLVKLVWH